MTIQPRPEIVELSEAIHGGIDDSELRRLGIDSNSVIDFSVNGNPFGPSPEVVASRSQVPLDRYPDRDSTRLRQVVANRLACSAEQLLAGNGSSELLWLIAFVYLRPADKVLNIGPTYSEFARSAVAMGAQCLHCNAIAESNFAVPVEAISQMLRTASPRMVYLCNPNNPTGQCIAPTTIETWAHEFDQTLFVIDEAYIEFVSEMKSLVGCKPRNVAVLRSLSKAYGLAGLRLGYVFADLEIIRALGSVRIPWSVNAVAQAAGAIALEDEEHRQRSLLQLHESKQTLIAELESLGLNPFLSATHFFLIPVGDATRCRSILLRSGVLVRDGSSFGLPGCIRVATRCATDNARLVAALASSRPLLPALV